jgi:CHASE2 domain-containing sensor protein
LKALQLFLARQNHLLVRWVIVLLIALLSVFRVIQLNSGIGFDPQSYDQLIKRRVWGPAVDPHIVIVDIDERSLEKMRAEFGRWPWPRETLAGALQWLNQKGASVVVFDILFADPDTLNPASDLAFVEAIKQSSNSYFPVLRLHPSNDNLSQVRADQLQGFASPTDPSHMHTPPSLAVVAPAFDALVQTQRLGYHNIYADDDGVNRSYRLWEEKEGWRLWSLPARLASDLGWVLPDQPRQLIHFTSTKAAYTQISFSEVWALSQSLKGQEKDPRFDNAIVIIGSTATSLFDVKVTPIDTTRGGL